MNTPFCCDVIVEREEANFDRACEQAKKIADQKVQSYIDKHSDLTGDWLRQESLAVNFVSYSFGIICYREPIHQYFFSCIAILKD